MKKIEETSKFLSFILRHSPESIGIKLDSEGWADIGELIVGAEKSGRRLTRELIAEVVATNDKKRFALSPDGQSIRAVQGHSTPSVSIAYVEKTPPEFLYHGTASRFIAAIRESGLKPGTRHHVHLSLDKRTATIVGSRHGVPVILTIAAREMQLKGFKFYQADNGVWLTENVPKEYLTE